MRSAKIENQSRIEVPQRKKGRLGLRRDTARMFCDPKLKKLKEPLMRSETGL